ncbi:MAG TPA: GNAT family N-acetyltransferase [Pilimelia sp.]|nr:GNAT family N-acetyltransferase [Pilimelia sp.]
MTTDGELCCPASTRWMAALDRVAHDAYHHPAYVEFDANYCAGRPVGFLYEESGHVFLLPLVLRMIPGTDRCDAVSPYGYPSPISDTQDQRLWDAAVDALVRKLGAEGSVSCFVRMHPLLGAQHASLARVGTLAYHGDTVSIDLRRSEEEMWQQVRGNHRRHIHRARRLGRMTAIDDWGFLDDFIDIYHETMRRVGAADYYFFPHSYFAALRDALGECLHLAVVLADGTAIGGGLFFEEDGIVQYHLGGSRAAYLPEQPSKLLIDDVRRWASARGNTALHLGSGVGGRNNPLFHFKAGFSDARHEFHTWRIVLDPDEYGRLTVTRNPQAASVSANGNANANGNGNGNGYFPAYRTP